MAGEAVEVSLNLKEALIESLNAVLSPDESVRKAAEQRIEAIEVTDGTFNVFRKICIISLIGVIPFPQILESTLLNLQWIRMPHYRFVNWLLSFLDAM